MAPDRPPIRLTTPSLLLALALVLGSATPAIARDMSTPRGHALGGSATRSASQPDTAEAPDLAPRPGWRPAELASVEKPQVRHQDQPRSEIQLAIQPPTLDVPAAKPTSVARATAAGTAPASARTAPAASFKGRNHVWIPSLGVSRSITPFSCTSDAYPGDRVYRWGCAGSNNVYLFGHAQSVFQPLHDAYVSGRLREGMALYYAGDDGTVHTYTVRWWKVTTPDKGAWAYASQSVPSLTLQTCVGASSRYRLVVRLVQTD